MPKSKDSKNRLETAREARVRRQTEIQQVIANEMPHHSGDISYAFVRRDFVEAITRSNNGNK